MNPEPDERSSAEDLLLEKLVRAHRRLLDPKESSDGLDPDGKEPEDPRLHGALEVLGLIEAVKRMPSRDARETENLLETPRDLYPRGRESLRDLDSIGRFEIRGQLGRGGYGYVLRAWDPSVEREVALKVLRLDAALASDARERFAREAKAAAALNHPGIVSVYETGSWRGVDYLVTELVEGETLAARLAANPELEPDQAAELIAQLADAMEHAHQRGVWHRDLKPANVLLRDGQLEHPKIADFGLAAIVDQAELTQTGAVVGTPAYMSPEQAAGKRGTHGPGTDIHGLGAMLYELLSGQPPFASRPIVEMLAAIAHEDPPPPRRLRDKVPSDLEAICLKCLEKDPRRRYPTCRELQADLERYLARMPVVARPVTSVHRGFRWIHRNPWLSGAVSAALLGLVIALIASLWGWHSTSRALERETRARDAAREAIDQFYTRVAETDLLDLPGLTPLRQRLLERSLGYYEAFLADQPGDEAINRETAEAHYRVGRILNRTGQPAQAVGHFEQAKSYADSLNDPVGDGQPVGDPGSAGTERSAAGRFNRFQILGGLAESRSLLGENPAALELFEEAVMGQRQRVATLPGALEEEYQLANLMGETATLLRQMGRFPEANELGTEALDLLLRLAADDPGEPEYARRLAGMRSDLAIGLEKVGDLEVAAAQRDAAIDEFQNVISEAGPTPKDLDGLAGALYGRATGYLKGRDLAAATPLLEEADDLAATLVLIFPNVPTHRNTQVQIRNALGFCYNVLQRPDDVEQLLRGNIELLEDAALRFPEDHSWSLELATARLNLGVSLAGLKGAFGEAEGLLQQAIEGHRQQLMETPELFEARLGLGLAESNLAGVYNDQKKYQESLDEADGAIARLLSLNLEQPGVPQVVDGLANSYLQRGRALERRGRLEESIVAWRMAAEQETPRVHQVRLGLAQVLAHAGQVEEATGICDSLREHPVVRAREAITMANAQAAIGQALANGAEGDRTESDARFEAAQNWLRIALETGQFHKESQLERLRQGADYAELREQAEFQDLVSEIEASLSR